MEQYKSILSINFLRYKQLNEKVGIFPSSPWDLQTESICE